MEPPGDHVTLSWNGPFSWVGDADSLVVAAPRGPGIYLWALPLGDAYLPYYVGESTFQDSGLSYQRRADNEQPLLITVENAPKGSVVPATFQG